MIVDAHSHVSLTDYGDVDKLIRAYDEAGIDKGIVVPGGMVDVREMSLYISGEKPSKKTIPNEAVYQALEKYPDRLKGFVCINPLDGEKALELFEEGVDRGCVGVKLNPMSHKFAFSGPILDEVAKRCGERGFPVYSHTLFSPGANTLKFAAYAERHPQTNFVIGHMGFGALDVKAIDKAAELSNLFLETSTACFLNLTEALKKLPPEKLLFGVEFPMSTPKIQLYQIRQLPQDVQSLILSENVLRLVPSLKN